jgi:hypothetical protein
VTLDDTDMLVSLDIVNLFNNVPIDEALSVVKKNLVDDDSSKERSKLSVNAIMELLEICLKTSYFKFDDKFYEQKK